MQSVDGRGVVALVHDDDILLASASAALATSAEADPACTAAHQAVLFRAGPNFMALLTAEFCAYDHLYM